jgi:hypothetical protein
MITYDAPAPVPTPIQGRNTLTMKGIQTPLEENWVIDQGQLWYVWPI